jgi:hypothetical protein
VALDDRLALSKFLEDFDDAVTLGLQNARAEFELEEWDRLLGLWQAQRSRIAEVRTALEQGDSSLDDALENVGLTGEERQLKHDVFDAARAAYEAEPTSTRFGDVLEAADITLGSLGLIFPVVHAIEEIKEIVEYLLDKGRDWLRDWLWPFGRR